LSEGGRENRRKRGKKSFLGGGKFDTQRKKRKKEKAKLL
jgi:hypothetical protein